MWIQARQEDKKGDFAMKCPNCYRNGLLIFLTDKNQAINIFHKCYYCGHEILEEDCGEKKQ